MFERSTEKARRVIFLRMPRSQILEAAKLIFTAQGWAKTVGKIEDVQFVCSKAAMATLVWQGKPEKPNPGCVVTVILTEKPEG